MAVTVEPVPVVDPTEVAVQVFQVFKARGLTTIITDAEGTPEREVEDDNALYEMLYNILDAETTVSSVQERSKKALTNHALAARVFPNYGPLCEGADADPLEEKVISALKAAVNGRTSPDYNNPLQQMFGERGGKTLVKNRLTFPTGRQVAVYVTSTPELLLVDYDQPAKLKAAKAIEKYARNIASLAEVHPAMASQLTKSLETGVQAAADEAKATLALTVGGLK